MNVTWTRPNRIEVRMWARRLMEADEARREAEETYQRAMAQLRLALQEDREEQE